MKNLIYQYWDGNTNREGIKAGIAAMREYAKNIGASYLFEDNPRYIKYNLGLYTPHYGAFKPVLENWNYDNILVADVDVFPVYNLSHNIFEEENKGIALCREAWQTKFKPLDNRLMDRKWAHIMETEYGASIPKDSDGNVIIYNSGVVLYSKEGIEYARTNFNNILSYVSMIARYGLHVFYTSDQYYLHGMLCRGAPWNELSEDWNRYIHYLPNTMPPRPINDTRTPLTKFVHVQLRGADDFNKETLFRIVNLPESEWRLPV